MNTLTFLDGDHQKSGEKVDGRIVEGTGCIAHVNKHGHSLPAEKRHFGARDKGVHRAQQQCQPLCHLFAHYVPWAVAREVKRETSCQITTGPLRIKLIDVSLVHDILNANSIMIPLVWLSMF